QHHVAADAVDGHLGRGDAHHVDVRRHRVDLQVGAQRHHHVQPGRAGVVARQEAEPAAPRVFHPHAEAAVVAVDLELLDALAERTGNPHLGSVPGLDVDTALEVVDLDPAVGVERTGLVDRRIGPGSGCRYQQGEGD